jgi:hypothetical protein
VRYVWLAVIGLSLVPVAFVSIVLNPLVFLMIGADVWHERVARFRPYRWAFTAAIAALGIGVSVYSAKYGY